MIDTRTIYGCLVTYQSGRQEVTSVNGATSKNFTKIAVDVLSASIGRADPVDGITAVAPVIIRNPVWEEADPEVFK